MFTHKTLSTKHLGFIKREIQDTSIFLFGRSTSTFNVLVTIYIYVVSNQYTFVNGYTGVWMWVYFLNVLVKEMTEKFLLIAYFRI